MSIDIRSWGKKSYVKVRDDKNWREWERICEGELDVIPKWLMPLNHSFDFVGAKEGDGRNDKLFSYIITLTNDGFSREEVRRTFELINKYIFADSMEESEIETITRDEAFSQIRPAFFVKRQFLHDKFALFLKQDNRIYYKWGKLYMYDKDRYVNDLEVIEEKMTQYISRLTQAQRNEVLAYLRLKCDRPSDPSIYHINCVNGILDIRTSGLIAHSPEFFIPNMITAKYDELAYDEDTDKFLNRICCHDEEVRMLVEEMIGYIMIPTSKFQKSFILYGDGSNGKSTLLDCIIGLVGDWNITSLSLKEINHNFKLSEISDKLANIGDDISDEYITDSSTFKKLVTGEEITADVKHKSPIKIRNYATMVFAANNLPNMSDKSNGMIRRLTVIPFNAIIRPSDPDYDPFIIDKITTDSAKSYLLNLGLKGIQRVFGRNGFVEPESVKKMLDEYEMELNNVIQFIDDFGRDFDGLVVTEFYTEYVFWCTNNNKMPFKIRKFNHEIKTKFNGELVQKRVGGQVRQCWKKS